MSSLLQRMRDKYVGKKFTVNCGWTCEVLDYKNNKEVLVRWEEDGTEQIVKSGGLGTGNIRPKYRPTIAGIGINDLPGLADTSRGSIYQKWVSMIKRCYCEKYVSKKPTYLFVEVDKPWLRFSNFYKWASKFKCVEEQELDKDITGNGYLYSEENCLIVPRYINGYFLRIEDPKSFSWKSHLNKWEVNSVYGRGSYLGVYSTKEEAFSVYKKHKIKRLEQLLKRYRGESFYCPDVEEKIRNSPLLDKICYE